MFGVVYVVFCGVIGAYIGQFGGKMLGARGAVRGRNF